MSSEVLRRAWYSKAWACWMKGVSIRYSHEVNSTLRKSHTIVVASCGYYLYQLDLQDSALVGTKWNINETHNGIIENVFRQSTLQWISFQHANELCYDGSIRTSGCGCHVQTLITLLRKQVNNGWGGRGGSPVGVGVMFKPSTLLRKQVNNGGGGELGWSWNIILMSGTCLGRVQTINKMCCEGNTSVSVLKLQMMCRSGKELVLIKWLLSKGNTLRSQIW